MPNPVLADLQTEVAATVGAMQSATVFINGTAARLEAAVLAALANGATAEELAPITAEISAMKSERDNLASAIAANDDVADEPVDDPNDPTDPANPVDPNLRKK